MLCDAVLGQQQAIDLLQAAVRSGRIAPAYLFTGIEGTGKFTAAVAFAKALNCREQADDFCAVCAACRKIDKRLHPDCFFIEPDKNVIRIEQVREMQKKIIFKPLEGNKKVVIIDQAERLNLHAANCLLKTLEEPPDDTVLILVANTGAPLLPTIRSRCQIIRFAPLSTAVIRTILRDKERGTDIDFIAALSQGSVKRALALLETGFLAKRREIVRLLVAGSSGFGAPLLQLAKLASDDQQHIPHILEFLQTWYRDLFVLLNGFPEENLYNRDLCAEMQDVLINTTREQVLQGFKKLQWINAHRTININYTLALESMLLQSL